MSTPDYDDAGVTPTPSPAIAPPQAVVPTAAETTVRPGYGLIMVAIGWAVLAVAMLAIGGAVFVGIFEAIA